MSGQGVVYTQLIVDATGAQKGVADFKAQMAAAKAAAVDTGQATATSFEQAQKRWQQSLAATDPVIKAQIRMEQELAKQREISTRALSLGIGTLESHGSQMEKVRRIQQGYVDEAKRAAEGTTAFGKASAFATAQLGPLLGLMSVGAAVAFAKSIFEAASSIDEMAQQAGVGTEALQAYRAQMLQSGIDIGQTDQILTRLTRSIGTAIEGSSKQRDAFVQLGIGIDTLRGGAEETLPAVARALLNIGDASERAKIEVDLFGKTGQKLESALRALVDPTSTLIEKQRALGQIMGTELTESADKAADRLTEAWNKVKIGAAPGIVWLMEKLAKLTELNDKLAIAWNVQGRGDAAQAAQSEAAKNAAINAQFGIGQTLLVNGRKPTDGQYSTSNFDTVLSRLREEADLTGKTAQQVAITKALREAEAAQIKDGNGKLDERQIKLISSLAVVRSTYEERQKASKQEKDDIDKVEAKIASLAADYEKEGLRISDKNKERAAREKEYIDTLSSEVELAGMGADEREREAEVLNYIRRTDGEITEEKKNQIRGLVALRQETEKYRQLVDGIANSFQGFFEDILENGKLSFGKLWDAIKSQFVQMLAYMASQALIQPIIIPMVQGIMGTSGLGSLFGGGSSGAMGMLSNAGSLSSLFGGGSSMFSGISSMINGWGGALGFATPGAISSGAGLSGALGGISRVSTPALNPGGLFGSTTLMGALGGFGMGSLIGGMMGGNSLVSGGLGLAGTLIGGPLGGILGGALGGALGNFGASNQGAISNFTNDGLGNTLFKAGGGQNGQLATGAAQTINDALKALRGVGVDVSLGNISGLSIGSDKSYVYDFAGGKQKLAGGQAGVEATVNAILDRILPSASSSDESVNAILQKYRDNGGINSGNITQLAKELQDAKDQVAKDAADALTANFSGLIDKMKTLAGQISTAGNAAQKTADSWAAANGNLRKASDALLLNDPSLSPTALYNNSKARLNSLKAAARGGDVNAANDYASFQSQFLQTSFGFNGSTTAYQADKAGVVSDLADLSTFTEGQRSLAQQQADSLASAVAQLQAIGASIDEGNKSTAEGLAEMTAAVDSLEKTVKDGNLLVNHA